MQEENSREKVGIESGERTLDEIAGQAGMLGCPRKKTGGKMRLTFQRKPGERGITGDGPAMDFGYN